MYVDFMVGHLNAMAYADREPRGRRFPPQPERIGAICDTVVRPTHSACIRVPDLLHVCEGASLDTFKDIEQRTTGAYDPPWPAREDEEGHHAQYPQKYLVRRGVQTLTTVAECSQDDTPEHEALLERPDLAGLTDVETFNIGTEHRRQALRAQIGELSFVGAHYPWHVRANAERAECSRQILREDSRSISSDADSLFPVTPPDVIMLDANSVPAQESRRIFRRYGYTSVASLIKGPKHFATDTYATFSMPPGLRWLKLQLDDILVKEREGLRIVRAGVSLTETDHPYFWAMLRIHAQLLYGSK